MGVRCGVIFALAGMSVPVPAAADTAISVVNSGFEQLAPDGTVTGWRMDAERSGGGVLVSGTEDVAHLGVGSLQLTNPTATLTLTLKCPLTRTTTLILT